MTLDEQINIYDEQIRILKLDQGGKLYREDDHGVMDCSADIRELKAEKKGYTKAWNEAKEALARVYMRLQNADVPREPWHEEVSGILNQYG